MYIELNYARARESERDRERERESERARAGGREGGRQGGREAGREGETGREPSFMGGAAEGRFVEIPLMNQRLDAES